MKRVLALNSKHNGLALLFKPVLSHCNCFLKSVATNGKDEHGLKLFNFFQVLMLVSAFLTCKYHLRDDVCLISSLQ